MHYVGVVVNPEKVERMVRAARPSEDRVLVIFSCICRLLCSLHCLFIADMVSNLCFFSF